MGGRFKMSSSTCCKMKALMILAMLAVSEGRRIKEMSDLKSHGAFSTHEAAGNEASPSLDSDPAAAVNSPVDVLLNDPAFKEQLVSMAGSMDEFALLIKEKAPPGLLALATNMAEEIVKLSMDPKSSMGSSLPENMELMIADKDFQKHAQAIADKIQENDKINTALQDSLEAAAVVAEVVTEVVADPEFQQTLGRVSETLGSLMQDPELLEQAGSLAAYLESMKDSQDSDVVEKMSEKIDAMIASKSLKAKASAVVSEMLGLGSEAGSESVVIEELKVMRNSNDEDKTLEAKKETDSSFLEESSGHKDAIPLLFAVNGLLPVKPSESGRALQAKGFPGMFPRTVAATPIQMKKESPWSEEWAEEKLALQQTESAPVVLTSANEIRKLLPSLGSALQQRGGSTRMAVKDEDGNAKKKLPVDEALLICFALWYLGNYYYKVSNKLALTAAGGATLARVVVAFVKKDAWLQKMLAAVDKGATVASSALDKSAVNMKSAMKACGKWAVNGKTTVNIVAAFAAASCAGIEIFELGAEELASLGFHSHFHGFGHGGDLGLGGHHGLGIMAVMHLFNALHEVLMTTGSLAEKKEALQLSGKRRAMNMGVALSAAACAAIEMFELVLADLGLHFMQGVGHHHGAFLMAMLHPFSRWNKLSLKRKGLDHAKGKLKVNIKSAMHTMAAFAAASCAGIEVFEVAAEDLAYVGLHKAFHGFGHGGHLGLGGHHGVGIMAVLHLFNALDEVFENKEVIEENTEELRAKTE